MHLDMHIHVHICTYYGMYGGDKLLEHAMKIVEKVLEKRLRKIVTIDDMQFGFMSGKGTIDAVFILRQIQDEYLAKQKKLCMCFVDLEKAFDGSNESCGIGNEKERYSRSIGYSSDEPVHRCKDKSESWNTFI